MNNKDNNQHDEQRIKKVEDLLGSNFAEPLSKRRKKEEKNFEI